MECIYYPELTKSLNEVLITGDEARHMRVLNIRSGEQIMISNGTGLCATGVAERISKLEYKIRIEHYSAIQGELGFKFGLAIGILDSRDRFEFAIEKAVELGVTHIYPLITENTQRRKIERERLNSKSIAALKQCKRACLPIITEPIDIVTFSGIIAEFRNIFLLDIDGNKPKEIIKEDLVVIAGPEGGFSKNEIEKLKFFGALPINLGNRRLRGETAAIAALSFYSLVQ
jgi:16S rRNA (uracil1498-N3)-methyltransferase